ncbi:MAG: acyl-CoA dehydrogenase family protein [Hyphomonadaceae bacterium]
MDMDFSESELAFRDEVRAFLQATLTDRLRQGFLRTPGVFVEPDIATEWHRALNKKGWATYTWPVEDGGTDWTPTQRYIFEKELATAGSFNPTPISLRLIGPVICAFGTPEQKSRFLPGIRNADDFWCQGYSEPGSGSDLASLTTKASLEGDKYVINGSKIWTTHAHHANWIFCLVRTDATGRKQDGITFLLIPMDQPGVKVTPIISMSGDHEVNQVFFDNAVSAVDNRIGDEGEGWKIAKFLLQNERGGTCFGPRALAEIDRLKLYASEAPSGVNGPLSHDQTFSIQLAKLTLRAKALEVTELRILADLAKGRSLGPKASLTKLISSNLRQDIQKLESELFAYDGLQLPYDRPLYGNSAPKPISNHAAQNSLAKYLNGRAMTIYGGSNEVQKNIIAKHVLGLS